jgi:uncharacterized protein YgiB involved in biofilm formation
MKRSSMIFLGATGLLVAGAWLGRSGGPISDHDNAQIYDNIGACAAANVLTRDQCEAEFAAAEARHLTDAPRFSAAGDCEAQYGPGQCKPATIAGTNYFLPTLAGVLIAQRLMGQRQPQALLPPLRAQQPCAPGFTPVTQPGCVVPRATDSTSSGSWRSYSTAGGATVSRDAQRSGPVTVPRSITTGRGSVPSVSGGASQSSMASSQISPVSRGGFGSTARSTSSSSAT